MVTILPCDVNGLMKSYVMTNCCPMDVEVKLTVLTIDRADVVG